MNVLFIGGFASNSAQLRYVERELDDYFSVPVKAYSLRYALTHADEIVELARGATVITHSAGILAALELSPKSLWIIAPPRAATRRRDLLNRSARKTMELWYGAFHFRPRLARVVKYHLHATPEVLFNLTFYLKLLRDVSQFDLTAFMREVAYEEVFVVHMTKDSLYSHEIDRADMVIEGEHDEILLYPVKVIQAAKIQLMAG